MRFLPQEVIRRKRDGGALDAGEISSFVRGITDGSITEGQVAAFAMAVFLRDIGREEVVALTLAMRDSGTVLRWDGLDGPVLDKHSTGGVGDKVSLVLAPLLAACGAYVPMLSGRGLGHTGGTLDKLEAIPGYATRPDLGRLRRVVREAGCAVVGQTDDLAPADRRLYAVRDVTATVESVPLITASILSKKLAAGPQALVMDVKVGSGAFMPGIAAARDLARSIIEVARGAGLACAALLTDMDQCLGRTAGNALEVAEAVAFLRGDGPATDARLREVTLQLAAEALRLGGLAASADEGRARAELALSSGAAAERFARMVAGLGGPADLLDRPDHHLPRAPVVRAVHPDAPGRVASVDVRALGLVVVGLGGGRLRADGAIDPRVGLDAVAGVGEAVGPEHAPLCLVHAADEGSAETAAGQVRAAFAVVAGASAAPSPVVRERLA